MKLIIILKVFLVVIAKCELEKISLPLGEKNDTFPAINMTTLAFSPSKTATITNIRFKGVLLNSTDIAINGEWRKLFLFFTPRS